MNNRSLKNLGISTVKSGLNSAFLILKHTFQTTHALLNAFSDLRSGKHGPTSDKEQDILRAMLVFAASGLDATIKQIIKDNIESIINNVPGSISEFEKFTNRKLRKVIKDVDPIYDSTYLSKLLVTESPRQTLIDDYKIELISNSLQSSESLMRLGACLDIPSSDISSNFDELKDVFKARNEIVHEMDIDLSQPSHKTRHQRKRGEIIRMTNILLDASEKFMNAIDKKLP